MGTIKPWLAAALLGTGGRLRGRPRAFAAKDNLLDRCGAGTAASRSDRGVAAAAIDEVVFINVFEGLVRLDERGHIQPLLAESWTISDDGLTYTFKLRPGREIPRRYDFRFGRREVQLRAGDGAEQRQRAEGACSRRSRRSRRRMPRRWFSSCRSPAGQMLFNLTWGDAAIVAPRERRRGRRRPGRSAPARSSSSSGSRVTGSN